MAQLDGSSVSRERLEAECRRLYEDAHNCMVECLEPENVDYQSGVKAAMLALFHRVTGGSLSVESDLIVTLPHDGEAEHPVGYEGPCGCNLCVEYGHA